MLVSVVVGTRPEIVKMAPVVLALRERGLDFELLHTGQHYDRNLSELFFEELDLPKPHKFLSVGSGSQGEQTANALMRLEQCFKESGPDIVLVEGDTNTVLAGALAAVKMGIRVGHVEAGLRSYDNRMPEEHNRRVADHVSSELYAPTKYTARTLEGEKVWGKIHVTGNTVIDACVRYLPKALENAAVMDGIKFDQFILATAHRAENVDDPAVLGDLVEIFTNAPLPVVYPIHPRTVARLKENGLHDTLAENDNVQLIEPVGYLEFLVLMKKAAYILSDSGGIQEEATAPNLRKRVFVLRDNTERPEAAEAGFAEVVGTDPEKVLGRLAEVGAQPPVPDVPSPFGAGDAGKKIAELI